MPLTLTQTVPPLVEPVTVPDLKLHLRIDHADEDGLLAWLISVARDDVETYLRRQLLPATWTLALDDWPTTQCQQIRLPRPPALAVASVQYYNTGGLLTTLDPLSYAVDTLSQPGRLALAGGATWPALETGRLNSVLITYQAGYASTSHVPPAIRHAIKLLSGALYENREAQIQLGNGVSKVEDNPLLERLLYKFRLLEV